MVPVPRSDFDEKKLRGPARVGLWSTFLSKECDVQTAPSDSSDKIENRFIFSTGKSLNFRKKI
jgi:hypothetical protein